MRFLVNTAFGNGLFAAALPFGSCNETSRGISGSDAMRARREASRSISVWLLARASAMRMAAAPEAAVKADCSVSRDGRELVAATRLASVPVKGAAESGTTGAPCALLVVVACRVEADG